MNDGIHSDGAGYSPMVKRLSAVIGSDLDNAGP